MNEIYIWLTIAVISLMTALTRFLPFLLWSKSEPPAIIKKLGGMLPYAVMGMLVVYCLKDVGFASFSDFMPELIACIVVAVSYILKRNTLISIIAGTLCYMLLVQRVFI